MEIQPLTAACQNQGARTNQSPKLMKLIQIKILMVPKLSCGINSYERLLKPAA